MLGNICASVLSLAFFWTIKNWALDSFLGTLLFEHSVLIVRLVLCVAIYIALFLALKAVVMSLKFVSMLPVIKYLDRIIGLFMGGIYGIIIVGILTLLYEWILQ